MMEEEHAAAAAAAGAGAAAEPAAEAATSEGEEGREEKLEAEVPPQPPRAGDLLGRHRLSAAISRLTQEIQSLEEELEGLDRVEPSSAACKELLFSIEEIPDALLPVTRGPQAASWDRWFQRVRSSHGNKWWAHKGSDFF